MDTPKKIIAAYSLEMRFASFSLTSAGHVEGSRAFSRYRAIDMDMKMDLVKILEGAK